MNIQRFLSTGNVASFLQKLQSISDIVSYHPYIERQVQAFCGLHALNHIFQKELFVYVKIDKIFLDDQFNLFAFEQKFIKDFGEKQCEDYVTSELNRIQHALILDASLFKLKPLPKNANGDLKLKYENDMKVYNNMVSLQKNYANYNVNQIKDAVRRTFIPSTYLNDFRPSNSGNFQIEILLGALNTLHYPIKSFSWAINPSHPRNEEITPSQVKAYIDDPTCIGILINKGNWHYGAAVLTIPGNRYCFADPFGVPDDRILINYHTSDLLLETILHYNAKKLCFIFVPE